MRRKIKILLLILLATQVKGQDLFLIDKKSLTLGFLDSIATNLGVVDLEKAEEISGVLKLDVFNYFQLYGKYDTELKRKVFMESVEYKNLLEKTITEKRKIENSFFYIRINPLFKSHAYNKGEYNLKDKGFYIKPCKSNEYDFPHKIDKNYIIFKAFPPSKLKTETEFGKTTKWEEFFIPLSESDGINIENDPKNYSYIVIFKINSFETVVWDMKYGNWKISLPKVNKLRLLVIENNTKKIYFDEIFTEIIPKKTIKRK